MNTNDTNTTPAGIADKLAFFRPHGMTAGPFADAVAQAIAFLRALEPTADVTLPMSDDSELVHELVHAGNDDGHAGHLMMSEATRKARDALLLRLTTWRAAMQEFVDRVECGDVKSRHTYGKFKALLAVEAPALTPHDAAEVAKFQAFLADKATMTPAALVEKHAEYMGVQPQTPAGIDFDSDEPVNVCGIGMAAGEACESCQ